MSEDNMFSSGYSMEIYKTIENDFINYIKYVPLDSEFEKTHLEVCSPILADLLLRICSQVEIFFTEWVKLLNFDDKNDADLMRGFKIDKNGKRITPKIFDYIDFIDTQVGLKQEKVKVRPLNNKKLLPFSNPPDSNVPPWWTAYNKSKHDGFREKKRANLNNVMTSLSGLFLLHCLNWANERKALVENNMTRVTDHGLSLINSNFNKINAREFRVIRTPHYFRYVLFEYERD